MQAVSEKKEMYRNQSIDFVQRFKHYMEVKFRESESKTTIAFEELTRSAGLAQLDDERLREKPKQELWKYSPFMFFVREIGPSDWDNLIRMYQATAKEPYRREFKDNIEVFKRITRKPIGDDSEVLFTALEKESESLVGRKLTVKRTKTVRADGSSRISSSERLKDGKYFAFETFGSALKDQSQVIFIEQNFIVDFFHASSLTNQDFVDLIASDAALRGARDLHLPKPPDPKREFGHRVQQAMDEIFHFWPAEMRSMIEWSVKQDSLNACGMLHAMETQLVQLEDTNQEFLHQTIEKLYDSLLRQFKSFIQEQVRAIEDTKVKIKKRKGLISFMKTFPNFCEALEKMLPPPSTAPRLPEGRSVRAVVDKAYDSANEAMFNTLKLIAKESPLSSLAQPGAATGGIPDTEDKEALNHHILMIENMHYYLDELAPRESTRDNSTLLSWLHRAQQEYDTHMSLYLAFIIRRPLGKLLEFLEKVEGHLKEDENPNDPPVAQRPMYGKNQARKSLGGYDVKEIRRGVETLRKRVEKHFSEGDGGDRLVGLVWEAAEEAYKQVLQRTENVCRDVYDGEVEVGWGVGEVAAAFRR